MKEIHDHINIGWKINTRSGHYEKELHLLLFLTIVYETHKKGTKEKSDQYLLRLIYKYKYQTAYQKNYDVMT